MIEIGETDAAKRRVPLYVVDGGLNPVTGLGFSAAQIRVSKAGAALVNFAGSYTEAGNGYYDYTLTLGEVDTTGFVLIYVNHPSGSRYVWVDQVGSPPAVNEATAANRRIPIVILDSSLQPVTALTFTGAEAQVSKAGGAWANAGGSVTEVSDGFYYYQGTVGDFDTAGVLKLKLVKSGLQLYAYEVGVGVDTGGSGATPSLTNPSPDNDTALAATRAQAKMTPVSFTVENYTTEFAVLLKFANDDRQFVVYDSATGFSAMFNTPQSFWDGAGRMTVFQLGGWQANIECLWLSGQGDTGILGITPGAAGSVNPPHS